MATENPHVVVLNDLSNTTVEQRERKSGSTHVTISFKSTPIAVHLDPLALGKPVAEAIRDAVRDGIKAIGETASEKTQLNRKTAVDAFARGAQWARARYSGGRTGPKAPAQSDRLFNDSGRLADGVTVNVNRKEGGFTLNAPKNRLDPSTFRSMADFQRMTGRLVELVPALQNPLEQPSVQAAIEKTWTDMHVKREMIAGDKQREAVGRLVLDVLSMTRRILGA